MSRMVAIPDDVYARLERQAAVRGIEVAELIATLERDLEEARLDAAEEHMRGAGLLLPRRHPSPDALLPFEPVPIQGKPLSETIVEERR